MLEFWRESVHTLRTASGSQDQDKEIAWIGVETHEEIHGGGLRVDCRVRFFYVAGQR